MSSDQYTHQFKYEVNGIFIRGECEFNTDEKASFKVTEWSQPIPLAAMADFIDVMEKVKAIYVNNNDIVKKIIIKEKEE